MPNKAAVWALPIATSMEPSTAPSIRAKPFRCVPASITALAGTALAYVWQERARPYLENGRLLSCLDDWIAPEGWLYLYYPTRKYLSAGLRAVIEALRA